MLSNTVVYITQVTSIRWNYLLKINFQKDKFSKLLRNLWSVIIWTFKNHRKLIQIQIKKDCNSSSNPSSFNKEACEYINHLIAHNTHTQIKLCMRLATRVLVSIKWEVCNKGAGFGQSRRKRVKMWIAALIYHIFWPIIRTMYYLHRHKNVVLPAPTDNLHQP